MKAPERWQTSLLFLAILPFWTNYLIRTYAWIVLLNPVGLINGVLIDLGLIAEPLPLLYNEFAVILGLVYNYTPFVILAIYSALQRLDPSYAEASRDLGAGAVTTFFRITLPLTAAGVAAGAVFVFVLSIGNFMTPDLLGGGKFQMIGNLIYDQFLTARDWPFGATLSALLIALMMILLFLQAVAAGRARGDHARLLNVHLGATYAFLYIPIAVLMVLSFNKAGLPTAWTGFSIEWYGRLASQSRRSSPPPGIRSSWRRFRPSSPPRSEPCWPLAWSGRGPRRRAMRCCLRP